MSTKELLLCFNMQQNMTNILLRLSNLEIKHKQIIKEKDISISNLQRALEKEQKLKA